MVLWQTVSTTKLSATEWTAERKNRILIANLAFHLIKAPFTLTLTWWFKFFPLKSKNATMLYGAVLCQVASSHCFDGIGWALLPKLASLVCWKQYKFAMACSVKKKRK
jgi:hypothetical protein